MRNKNILLIILVLCTLFMFSCLSEGKIFSYEINDDESLTITGCSSKSSDLEIPELIDGRVVTAIDDWAFYKNTTLKSITIPASIMSINGCAFVGCRELDQIIVSPQNERYFSTDNILFDKIDNELVFYSPKKTNVMYSVPQEILSIGDAAFYGNEFIMEVVIPDSVRKIDDYAFANCSKLNGIVIPGGVEIIGDYSFAGCIDMEGFKVSPDNCYFEAVDGVLYTQLQDSLVSYPASREGDFYIVSDKARSIQDAAFLACNNLKEVVLPEGITRIGDFAFNACLQMSNIALPCTLTSIGEQAFGGCIELRNISIPSSVTYIAENAFFGSGLERISIDDGIYDIGKNAFAGCFNIRSIVIPSSVTSIGEGAFQNCTQLTSIEIPNSVEYIDKWAFRYCNTLTIKAKWGSVAQRYAVKNDIQLDCQDKPIWYEYRHMLVVMVPCVLLVFCGCAVKIVYRKKYEN